MARCIDLLASTGNGPAPIHRLEPIHHSGEIFGDRQITAGQFLQRPHAVLSMVDRREHSTTQQIGQLASIDPVALVPDFQQGILPRIADHQLL